MLPSQIQPGSIRASQISSRKQKLKYRQRPVHAACFSFRVTCIPPARSISLYASENCSFCFRYFNLCFQLQISGSQVHYTR